MRLELTGVALSVECFFKSCIGLYKGHCCVLHFTSSSSRSLSLSVFTGLPPLQLVFDIRYITKGKTMKNFITNQISNITLHSIPISSLYILSI